MGSRAYSGDRKLYGQPLQAVLKFLCRFFHYFVISSFLSCHFSAYCLCLFWFLLFASFKVSSFHFIFICQAYFVYFCYYRSSVSFVMFHPVIITVCFSVIYLVSHIYPSPSSITLHHYRLNLSVTNQTATTQFKSLNTIPLSFILSSSRTQFRHTSDIFLYILILFSGDIQSNLDPSQLTLVSICVL